MVPAKTSDIEVLLEDIWDPTAFADLANGWLADVTGITFLKEFQHLSTISVQAHQYDQV
jgi:hypothetical protein